MALTPAGDILESATLTALNTLPISVPSKGEGAVFESKVNDDLITTTVAIVQNSTYHMGPRLPTNAKLKKVTIYAKGIDSNATAAVAADINLIFSDAPTGGIAAGAPVDDGTTLANANQIPTSALTGATTTIASYTSPNKMFASAYVLVANAGAAKTTDLTFNNTYTPAMTQQPLWKALGYTQDPGGFLDFFFVITAAASTAAAGTIYMKVEYCV